MKTLCLFLALVTGMFAWCVRAHEIQPSVVTVTFDQGGDYDVKLKVNMEALISGIPMDEDAQDEASSAAYESLRVLPPAQLESRIREFAPRLIEGLGMRFDGAPARPAMGKIQVPDIGDVRRGRYSTIRFSGRVPEDAGNFVFAYAPEFGSCALKITSSGSDEEVALWLDVGEQSEPYALSGINPAQSWFQVAGRYMGLGFTHIVPLGLDHILFVLGLFLLSLRWRPLLWQVTAFTVAHSITLGLTIYGLVSLSPAIVEPLIALSIVYVAVENLMTTQLKPWRILVVFGFGLLHGMGFAGVLQELGLPRSDFLTALLTFNIGVELGQLTVIGAAFLAVGVWGRGKPWYRGAVTVPGSLIIAVVGLYWTVQRVGW